MPVSAEKYTSDKRLLLEAPVMKKKSLQHEQQLSRRESKQLVRTTSDLFR
jgi:hypothetical protein